MKLEIPMFKAMVAAAAILAATAAGADPISGKEAAKALFSPQGAAVLIAKEAGLPAAQANALKTVLSQQPYYAAAAFSPDDGLLTEATAMVGNYHTAEAAAAVALALCNKNRKGASPCILAATTQPKGWKPRAVSLSADGTNGFKTLYPSSGGAMAVSPSTGVWAIMGDAKAALTACKSSDRKPKDCAIVIEN
jgi:hypothetical protein